MKHTVFLLGGRTGGPLTPLLAIQKNLPQTNPVILGIARGIESKFAATLHIPIHYLPETKLALLSHTKNSPAEKARQLVSAILQLILVAYSIGLSMYFIMRFKPAMILSAGSFLTVPVFFAAYALRKLRLSKVRLVLHQQDPQPGLASRIGIRFADIKSCILEQTTKYSRFEKCIVIPNPLDLTQFEKSNIQQLGQSNPDLNAFLNSPEKPVLLVFGGGSGAKVINDWVEQNALEITKNYRVLHLSGELQATASSLQANTDYLHYKALFNEMPLALAKADLVLCRSGLGSITELLYLHKPAYLVPMKHSHQEANAQAVKDYFYILDQDASTRWLESISTSYPQFFQNIHYPSPSQTQQKLQKYYQILQTELDKID